MDRTMLTVDILILLVLCIDVYLSYKMLLAGTKTGAKDDCS